MKNIILLKLFIFTAIVYSQNKFIYNQNGLVPEYTITNIDSISKTELYKKSLNWIKINYENPDRALKAQVENDYISFTGTYENIVKVDKRYYHIKYTVKISFKNGQYKFEPLEIQSKLNSKYDMGWAHFDLKNGTLFFKNGKIINKSKSYVTEIPVVLNDLNSNLYEYLITEKDNR